MKHPDLLEPLDLDRFDRANGKAAFAAEDARATGLGLIIDNFAGGGGASTGIEAAIGRAIDVAINHDPEAIEMHRANHPATHHYCQSVWAADPQRVVAEAGGGPVGLAWFSPDCKHFSKAKGGKPVEKNIRDLAWVVVLWAQRVRPRVIMLENVEEFKTWGPLIDVLDEAGQPTGKLRPNPERAGEEYARWMKALRKAGYRIEDRELRACDYGAPTSRKRLFVIARRDGEPIVWPEPTHGKPGTPEVESGERLPWRTAAEIIDWSIPCPSIFERKRPLKDATCRRIAHGIMRFVVNSPKPFIVPVCHTKGGNRATSGDDVVPTVTTAKGGELALVAPLFARTAHGDVDSKGKRRGKGWHGPLDSYPTVLASQDSALITAIIVGCGGRRGQSGPVNMKGPYPTTTAKADACLVAVALDRQFGRSLGADVDMPLPSITAGGSGKSAVIAATLIQSGYGEREGQAPRALDLSLPIGTIVAGGVKHALACATLVSVDNTSTRAGRFFDLGDPLRTITSSGGGFAAVTAFMMKYRNNSIGTSFDEPAPTVTANSFIVRPGGAPPLAVVAAHLAQHNTDRRPNPGRHAAAPVSTVTSKGSQQQLVASSLVKLRGTSKDGQPVDEPLHTVSAQGLHFAEVVAFLVKYYGSEQGAHSVEKPIDTIPTKDRYGLVTITIDGEEYVIADIGMRMLTARELARAQGFPDDYVLEPEVNGKPLTKTAQIRMIGNSVCPPMSEALVRANLAVGDKARAA